MTEPDLLLLERLSQNAARFPDKMAISFLDPGPNGGILQPSPRWTYLALEDYTDRLSQTLLTVHGIAPGDRAVLVYPPSLDFMVAFLACLKARIVAVPVFPPNPARRDSLQMFAKICQACEAQYALTNANYNYQTKLDSIKESITKLKRPTATWPENLQWIVTDHIHGKKHMKKSTTTTTTEIDSSSIRSQIAFLQFTSGSTSDPKGVMITHGNLAHNLSIITQELQAGNDTVVVSFLPQYHDMGLIGSYLGILYCGGTGYYMSPLAFVQRPMMWIEAIARFRATHLQAPNFAFKLTARKYKETKESSSSSSSSTQPPTLDLSSVRHIINAAEPVDVESMESFYQAFGPFGLQKVIFPTYGLAEHTVFVCSGGTQVLTVLKKELEVDGKVIVKSIDNIDDDDNNNNPIMDTPPTTKMVGCGYPSRQGIDVQIVHHESCEVLGEDTVGEIWVKSPSKALGYYNKPEETKEDFHARLKGKDENESDDGYLRTGDLGFMHDNELFICGRLKDLIIVGGRNYYPQDIEATAEASTDLVRLGCSAAFTIDPTHEGGEEVALVMELKMVPADNDIENVCATLANQIRSSVNVEHSIGLSVIWFLKPRTVPKTSSGKIARAWCRKGFLTDSLQTVYKKSFRSIPMSSIEIEQSNGVNPPKPNHRPKKDAATIRGMSREEILGSLTTDISLVGSLPVDSIDKKAPLVTMLDSLTISQFKGMLEANYHVRLSDEYLFRESTTVTKLVDVVQMGYAPDDTGGDAGMVAPVAATTGTAGGLAGALGCPPGVCCVIM
jgi:acyl-CoA synthetase (AMP-forming)/AMP-acid ligase II